MRHFLARNTIERAFGLLKKRWSILRHSSCFGKMTQVRIVNACFILHNFLREEKLKEGDLLHEVDNELSNVTGIDEEEEEAYISLVRSSPEGNNFRNELARKMFAGYQRQRA